MIFIGLYDSQISTLWEQIKPNHNKLSDTESQSKANVWQMNEDVSHLSAHHSEATREHPATHRPRDMSVIVIRGRAVFT